MDRETEVSIVRRVLAHADAGTTQLSDHSATFPSSRYTDEVAMHREQTALFGDGTLAVALSADLPAAGDHVVVDVAGRSLLLVRGDDGELRALVNACRHRGAPLAESGGAGARSFTCPFHGWVYGLDGALLATPRAGHAFDDVDLSTCTLPTETVRERGGTVFVGDEEPQLGGAEAELDAVGLADFVPIETEDGVATWVSHWQANWKLLIDTFLESYHVPRLHRDTVARYYLAEPSTWDAWTDALRFQTSQVTLPALAGEPEGAWDLLGRASVLYVLAPNVILSFSVDHVAWYRFVPLAADRTRVDLALYAPADAVPTPAQAGRTLALHRSVSGGEDFTQQEKIHAALASGALEDTIFGRNEGPAIWFHEWVAKAVSGT